MMNKNSLGRGHSTRVIQVKNEQDGGPVPFMEAGRFGPSPDGKASNEPHCMGEKAPLWEAPSPRGAGP